MQRAMASGVRVDLHPKRGEDVGRTGTGRERPVAVLCDWHPGASDHEGRAGRNVVGSGRITTSADDVHGAWGRVDPHHLRTHRRHRAGDLIDRLAANPQRHQQPTHLRRGCLARHHALEGGRGLVARQLRTGRDLADECLEFHVNEPVRSAAAPRTGRWRHSIARLCRENSSRSSGHARRRCSRDGIARRAPDSGGGASP